MKRILKIYKTLCKLPRYKVLHDSRPNSSIHYIEATLIKSIRKWINSSASIFYKDIWLLFRIYKHSIKLLTFVYIKRVPSNTILRSLRFKKRRSKIPMSYKQNRRLGFFRKLLTLFFRLIRRICSSWSWRATIIHLLYIKVYKDNIEIRRNDIGVYKGWNIIVGVPSGKRPREDPSLTDMNS